MGPRRLAAVLLIVGLAAASGSGAPAMGREERPRSGVSAVHELVSTTLDATGEVKGTSALELVRLPEEGGTIRVPSDEVAEYRNLSGFSSPEQAPDGFVWRASERSDSLSVATVDGGLPLDVEVRYRLDGRRVSVEDLDGASGHVRIEIRLRNVARATQGLTYDSATKGEVTEELPVYLPLQYSLRAAFPVDDWRELSVAGSPLTPDPEGNQNVSVSGLLAPPLSEASATVAIEAEADRAFVPKIQIFAVPGIPSGLSSTVAEQLGALRDLFDGLERIGARLADARDGARELGGGLDRLLAGVGRLDPDTGEPIDDPDDPQTLLGAIGAARRALDDRILPGVGARDPATGDPVVVLDDEGKPTTLLGALGFIGTQLEDRILPPIGTRDPETGEAIEVTDAQGRAQTLLWALQSTKDTFDDRMIPAVDQVAAGLDELLVGLDAVSGDEDPGFREGLEGIKSLATAGSGLTADPTLLTILGQIGGISDGLLASLGERNPDGSPKVTLDAEGNPTTVIGALGAIRFTALTNPSFNVAQPSLDGRVPFDYFRACPACFDPSTPVFDPATAAFQPGFREVFRLVSDGMGELMTNLQSFDPNDPGLVEGLRSLRDGLEDLAAGLHTFDAADPGLVDGLRQVEGGLDELLGRLHTFDRDDPGLVDGLQQAREGVTRLSGGLDLLRLLGIGTIAAQVGGAGDDLAQDDGILQAETERVAGHTFLATGADEASTTYLFTMAGRSTQSRDTAVRGGLLALSALAVVVLSRRPRLFGV